MRRPVGTNAGAPVLLAPGGSLPWLGDTLAVDLTGVGAVRIAFLLVGVSAQNWGGVGLPFDLGAIGMPGCSLYGSGETVALLLNIAGTARAALEIPSASGALDGVFYLQGLALDPAANAFGGLVSNALRGRVGSR